MLVIWWQRLYESTVDFGANMRWMQLWHVRRPMHHLWFPRWVHASLRRDLGLFAHAGISDAYYCAECTRLEKDRDGCPKIVNLGASRTDLFYERRRLGAAHSCSPVFSINFFVHRFQEGLSKSYSCIVIEIPCDCMWCMLSCWQFLRWFYPGPISANCRADNTKAFFLLASW